MKNKPVMQRKAGTKPGEMGKTQDVRFVRFRRTDLYIFIVGLLLAPVLLLSIHTTGLHPWLFKLAMPVWLNSFGVM